jgi:hypothetical protein
MYNAFTQCLFHEVYLLILAGSIMPYMTEKSYQISVYFEKISAQPTVEHSSTAGWSGKILLFATLCAMMRLK